MEVSRTLRNWSTQHRPLFLIKKYSNRVDDLKMQVNCGLSSFKREYCGVPTILGKYCVLVIVENVRVS